MNNKSRKTRSHSSRTLLTLAVAAVGTLVMTGAIVSTTSDVVQNLPASVFPGADESPTINAFEEQTVDVMQPILCNLYVDANYPGGVYPVDDLRPAILTPTGGGLQVTSHMLHFDPDGPGTANGRVRFDQNIICVMLTPLPLAASDPILGLPIANFYPTNWCGLPGSGCGVELNPDWFGIRAAPNHNEMEVNFSDDLAGDRMRVLTCPDPNMCDFDVNLL